jgi:hypothetical protein
MACCEWIGHPDAAIENVLEQFLYTLEIRYRDFRVQIVFSALFGQVQVCIHSSQFSSA